jgi:hypothetical protein
MKENGIAAKRSTINHDFKYLLRASLISVWCSKFIGGNKQLIKISTVNTKDISQ